MPSRQNASVMGLARTRDVRLDQLREGVESGGGGEAGGSAQVNSGSTTARRGSIRGCAGWL